MEKTVSRTAEEGREESWQCELLEGDDIETEQKQRRNRVSATKKGTERRERAVLLEAVDTCRNREAGR